MHVYSNFQNTFRVCFSNQMTMPLIHVLRKFMLLIALLLIADSIFASASPPDGSSTAPPDFTSLPSTKWEFKTKQPFISSPVIDGSLAYAGCLDSNLYAIDLNSGQLKWTFKTKGPIRSTVCINNDQLFLISGDGNFYCLDKNSGAAKWTFKTNGEKQYDIFDYFQSTPVVANNVVYFGSGDGNVYALNTADGKVKWNFQTGNVVHSRPAISGEKLYVGSFDGYVYALNMENGQLIWKFKSIGHDYFPKGEMQFSPAVANGMVYIGGRDYNMYALDAEKGYCHWNQEFPQGWVSVICPSQKNDTIIYIGTSDPDVMIAKNGITGQTLWQTPSYNVFNFWMFSENMAYVSTSIGKLYGVDLKTGTIQWTFKTDSYNTNRNLYFKDDDSFRDDILSILKTNADFINALYKVGGMFSAPAISNDYIVISTGDGKIYCLKRT